MKNVSEQMTGFTTEFFCYTEVDNYQIFVLSSFFDGEFHNTSTGLYRLSFSGFVTIFNYYF